MFRTDERTRGHARLDPMERPAPLRRFPDLAERDPDNGG